MACSRGWGDEDDTDDTDGIGDIDDIEISNSRLLFRRLWRFPVWALAPYPFGGRLIHHPSSSIHNQDEFHDNSLIASDR